MQVNSDMDTIISLYIKEREVYKRSHGVVVSTQDFEFCDPGSNPGGTFYYSFSC